MKKHINILFIISSILCYSQSGKVFYEAKIITKGLKQDENLSNEAKKLLNQVYKAQIAVTYILEFNKKESLFRKEERMQINDNKLNMADVQIGKGMFYSDLNQGIVLKEHDFFGENFLIAMPKLVWKLTQEKRRIGEYTCYKATTSYEILTRRGKSTRQVVAWFTSEIPFNFGPKEYVNLPGLIIELFEDKLHIKASKIELTKENKSIKKPNKGIKVSKKEYDSIVKKTLEKNSRYRN